MLGGAKCQGVPRVRGPSVRGCQISGGAKSQGGQLCGGAKCQGALCARCEVFEAPSVMHVTLAKMLGACGSCR